MKDRIRQLSLCLALFMLFCIQPLTAQAAEPVEYYGRTALGTLPNSAALLYAYDQIADGIENSAATISVYNGVNAISQAELELVMDTYRRDYAHHFWLGNSYGLSYNSQTILTVAPQYLLSGTDLTEAKADFGAEIEDILDGITSGMTDFDIELYFHDLLAERVTYTGSANAHNAYGALVEGKAVCEGYAEALQVLLHRAGIPSYLVTGWSRGEGHEWNLVCIDGDWYHVDPTWDDQGETLFHAYFNVSDAVITEDHVIDETSYDLPVCTSDEANYFTVKGGKVTEFDVAQLSLLMKAKGLTVHVWLDGDETTVDAYLAEYTDQDNLWQLIELTGATNVTSYSYGALGREMILHLEGGLPEIPEGITAEASALSDNRVYVTITGNLGGEAADLFVAVYDAAGRMIGIAAEQDFAELTAGIAFTVPFDGEADSVGVFALDDDGVPYSGAASVDLR